MRRSPESEADYAVAPKASDTCARIRLEERGTRSWLRRGTSGGRPLGAELQHQSSRTGEEVGFENDVAGWKAQFAEAGRHVGAVGVLRRHGEQVLGGDPGLVHEPTRNVEGLRRGGGVDVKHEVAHLAQAAPKVF